MPSGAGPTVTTLKLTGTAALGLLTGAQLTFSLSTLRHLVSPSAVSAALEHHKIYITLPLTLYGTSALVLTYLLSPSRVRHPYLLMASIMPIIGFGINIGVLKKRCRLKCCTKKKSNPSRPLAASVSEEEFEEVTRSVMYDKDRTIPSPGQRTPTSTEDPQEEPPEGTVTGYDYTSDEQAEVYRCASLLNAAVAGLGFAIGLVGNWGEGYYYYD